MAISKIKTGSITDSAVNTDKLAPGSVGSTDLSATVISGQTELSETAADTDFTIIYDTSAGALKKVLRSNLKQAGPTISSISPTNATDAEATATFTITGTGFTAGSNARFIDANGKITEFDTVTRNSATQITATIATSSLSILNDPYDIQVTNGEGIASILTSQVNFNQTPVFVTASGSLGTFEDSERTINVSVNATDPDSAGDVTFELQSGTLPPGLSLTNTSAEGGTAIISGTADAVGSDTTSNFVLRAVDAASNTTSRSFSITINAPSVQVFTSSGTFAVPSGVTSLSEVLVVGGGGSGGKATPANTAGGGGGAGGLIYFPGYPVTPGGTITVTVGCGAATTPDGTAPGQPSGSLGGSDSVFGSPGDPGFSPTSSVLTAKGGGGGGNETSAGAPGGSGGGSGQTNPAGSATQPTQPGNSGAYGFGNAGASGTGPTASTDNGGGGGAGASGSSGPSSCRGGDGGIGKAYTIADGTTPVYYAGGGGGGGCASPDTGGRGGQGGGGDGGDAESVGAPGSRTGGGNVGTANRGGGGGGGGRAGSPCGGPGGGGGKGVVIVRWG